MDFNFSNDYNHFTLVNSFQKQIIYQNGQLIDVTNFDLTDTENTSDLLLGKRGIALLISLAAQ